MAETTDYRVILSELLKRRKQNNTRYSLRAFARDLGMSAPRLSEVLNHKKGLSLKAAMTVSRRLGFNEYESQHFCDLVEKSDSRSETARKLAEVRLKTRTPAERFNPLNEDVFSFVSDWYHYAILELMVMPQFEGTPAWIAKALKISSADARAALERLIRLQFIEKKEGRFVRTVTNQTTSNNIPSEAIRHHNFQILQLAAAAIQNEPLARRNVSTMTMAVDSAKLPEAAERIRVFRRELCAFLEDGNPKDVYCLAVQLFPMSNLETLSGDQK